ncbi:MAG: hypothetical protein K6G61_03680 [Solobacterium sp.]|nr:hypothetical protein [Solobacterium sp.]
MKRILPVLLAFMLAGCSAPVQSSVQDSAVESSEQEQAAEEDPVLLMLETAGKYMDEGNYAKAVETWSQLISEDPGRPDFYIGRAKAYLASGTELEMRKAAGDDYRSALSIDPRQPDAYIGLAEICVMENNYGRAAAHLSNGILMLSSADAGAEYEEGLQALEAELAAIREEGGYTETGTVIAAENLDISEICMGSIRESYTENNGDTMYEGHLFFRVDGPQDAAAVFGFIASGYGFRGTDLEEDIQTLVGRYKENHPGRVSIGLPYYSGTIFTYAGSWETTQVCVIAVDENYDYVGHAIIEVVPGS